MAKEQGANFISRLHDGKLGIIPWPVIESRQFYTLFPTVKKMLDNQVVTHPKAGIFLQTMKTLMAKLKVGTVSPSPAIVANILYCRPMTGDRLTVGSVVMSEDQ